MSSPENAEAGSAEPQLGIPGNAMPLLCIPGSADAVPVLSREHQLGTPPASSHREWYSRGYLPHCDHPGLLQSITYRLADSLPVAVLEGLTVELRRLPPERQDAERRRQIEDWLDAGHGSCALRVLEAAACVVDTWRRFAGERYDLIAWVVMPNHVHVLIRAYDGVSLAKIVQSWKSYTGRRIRPLMGECRGEAAGRAPGLRRRSQEGVWAREYWDRFIRNEQHFNTAVAYIHENPVKAGLVATATDWLWSSAREYAASAIAEPGSAEPQLGPPGNATAGSAEP